MGSSTVVTFKLADYEIAENARSVDTEEVEVGLRVRPVPEAGEQQANVSLANADKCRCLRVAAEDDSGLV